MTNAVIYARYSEGPRQTDQSIEGQVADCQTYAKTHDMNVVKVYADRHVSGKSTAGRTNFLRMIDDAKQGTFTAVIVWKIDRFGRDRNDIAYYKYKLKKCGVKLFYAAENIPESPEGVILESLMEGLAEYYSLDLKQKIKRGIRESAKKGKIPPGQIPLGYERTKEGKLVPSDAAPYVAKAFDMYIVGRTYNDIRKMFFNAGISPKHGVLLPDTTLYRMFRNEHYTGKFRVQDVDVEIPPIISEETFLKAQRISGRHISHSRSHDYILTGRIFCGYCGSPVIGESAKNKYFYYVCSEQKHGKGCVMRRLKQSAIEDKVVSATMKDMLTDDMINHLADEVMKIQDEEKKHSPSEGLKKQIADIDIRISNLMQLGEKTGFDDMILSRIDALKNQRKNIEDEAKLIDAGNIYVPREAIVSWLEQFKNGDAENPQFLHRLIDTLVARIELKNDEITIYYNTKDKCSTIPLKVDLPKTQSNFGVPVVIGDYIILRLKL